ncbi:MAG: hypothetical protein ACJAZO_003038 [Myxococcota bacterium]|jgi:hypothetical protein
MSHSYTLSCEGPRCRATQIQRTALYRSIAVALCLVTTANAADISTVLPTGGTRNLCGDFS